MKKSWIFFSLFFFALVGCKASSKPDARNLSAQPTQTVPVGLVQATPPSVPKYGWKEFHEETFEAHTLEGKVFRLPAKSKRLRVKVRADSAVFGGVVRDAVLVAYGKHRKIFRQPDFQRMPCSLMSVDKSGVTCEIDKTEEMDYLVRDARAEGTMAGGLFGVFGRSHKMTEHAVLPNRIEISLSTWQCIENCKSLGREAK